MSSQKHVTPTYLLHIFTIIFLIGLLPTGSVLAQKSDPYEKKLPSHGARIPASFDAVAAQLSSGTNLLKDPSFEASFGSTVYWDQYSAQYRYGGDYSTPLCTTAFCGVSSGGHAKPRTGTVSALFGSTPEPEVAYVSQNVTIPTSCTVTLQFYFWIGFAGEGSGADDYFKAMLDGTTVFSSNATEISLYPNYTLVSIDISTFADGGVHTLKFQGATTDQLVVFNLDDVSIEVNTSCSISGNVGAPGVTLSYTDGTPKTATSLSDGSYLLAVSNNWTGTVTPSHSCYTFSPSNRSYSNVTTNKTSQNYSATFDNHSKLCGVTVGVFRPSNGIIFLKNSNTSGFADVGLNYGLAGDYPIVGDWDGNGTDTIGVYRGNTFLLRNSNTPGFADLNFVFGQVGDQPIAGDWDGDGIDTIGVFRPSTGQFLLRNTNNAGTADKSFYLGNVGDVGIAGDWNGDGIDTTGVFRPSNGIIFLKNTNETGFADVALNYGLAGDKPVVGDWDSNGTTTIGIYRGAKFYLRNSNTNGFADITLDLGFPTDMPIAGNWDGKP